MNIETVLSPGRTFCNVEASSKKKAIEVAARLIAEQTPPLTEQEIYSKLTAREKVSPTCLGDGIALPHCRLDGCDTITAALLTLQQPVDFEAIDEIPVNILFVLLVPEQETERHLQTMAMLVQNLEQPSYRAALTAATTNQALFERALGQADGHSTASAQS